VLGRHPPVRGGSNGSWLRICRRSRRVERSSPAPTTSMATSPSTLPDTTSCTNSSRAVLVSSWFLSSCSLTDRGAIYRLDVLDQVDPSFAGAPLHRSTTCPSPSPRPSTVAIAPAAPPPPRYRSHPAAAGPKQPAPQFAADLRLPSCSIGVGSPNHRQRPSPGVGG
jgi:hypothetical protein